MSSSYPSIPDYSADTDALPARTNVMAIVSLVFGILCWIVLPFLGALIAVICGHSARSEIRRAPPGTVEGDGMALCGLVLGWAHLLIFILTTFVIFAFLGGLAFIAQHF